MNTVPTGESIWHENLMGLMSILARRFPTVYYNLHLYGAMSYAHPIKMSKYSEFYSKIHRMIIDTKYRGVEYGALIYYSPRLEPKFVLGQIIEGDQKSVDIELEEPPKRGYYILGYVHTHPSIYGYKETDTTIDYTPPVPSGPDVSFALHHSMLMFGVGTVFVDINGFEENVVAWYYVNPDKIREYRVKSTIYMGVYDGEANENEDALMGGYLVHAFFPGNYLPINVYPYEDFAVDKCRTFRTFSVRLELTGWDKEIFEKHKGEG